MTFCQIMSYPIFSQSFKTVKCKKFFDEFWEKIRTCSFENTKFKVKKFIILIESYLDGREVTVGVYKLNEIVETLPITEIVSEMNDAATASLLDDSNEEAPPEEDQESSKSFFWFLGF